MKLNKFGQVTWYFIVGVVIVLVLAGFMVSRIAVEERELAYNAENVFSIGPKQSSLNAFVHDCVKETAIDAQLEYGLHMVWSPEPIKQYLINNLPECLNDFETFKKQGYKVDNGNLEVEVDITQEALVVEVNYPITLSKGSVILNIDHQTYTFPRTVMEHLNPDGWTRVVSTDGTLVLEVPPGTEVTKDGEPVDKIGIKQMDKEFNAMTNSITAGMLAFNGIPDGAVFSQPVKVSKFYRDDDLGWIPEKDLKVGYWNDFSNSWVGIPTEIDFEKNKLTAEIDHFTPLVSLTCGADGSIVTVDIPDVIKESDCPTCETEPWLLNEAKGLCPLISGSWAVFAVDDGVEALSYGDSQNPPYGYASHCHENDIDETVDGTLVVDDCIELGFDCHHTGCVAGAACQEDGECKDTPECKQYTCTGHTGDYSQTDMHIVRDGLIIDFSPGEGETCTFKDSGNRGIMDKDVNVCGVKGGNNCGGGNDAPVNIKIEATPCSPGDSCQITRTGDYDGNQITFDYKITNGNAPDTCMFGGAKITLEGIGIKEAKLGCDPATASATEGTCVSDVEGGGMSCMVCETGDDGSFWTKSTDCKAPEGGANSKVISEVPGKGLLELFTANVIKNVPQKGIFGRITGNVFRKITGKAIVCGTGTCPNGYVCIDENTVTCSNLPEHVNPQETEEIEQTEGICKSLGLGGGGGGGGETPGGGGGGRAECEGGSTDLPPCEGITIEDGMKFTTSKVCDTRDKKMCDSFGDIPAGTEFIPFNAVDRGGSCWLFGEIQQTTEGFKPDLYIRAGCIDGLTCKIDEDCAEGQRCIDGSCKSPSDIEVDFYGFTSVSLDDFTKAKELGADTVGVHHPEDLEKVQAAALKAQEVDMNVYFKLDDSIYNDNEQIDFTEFDFGDYYMTSERILGYQVLNKVCTNWDVSKSDLIELYDQAKQYNEDMPIIMNFETLDCIDDFMDDTAQTTCEDECGEGTWYFDGNHCFDDSSCTRICEAESCSMVETKTIEMSNFVFNPTSVEIKLGTTLLFVNNDDVVHKIEQGTLFYEEIASRGTFAYKFEDAGTYEVKSTEFSFMKTSIKVLPDSQVVSIENFAFTPATLTVKVGETVSFVNNDASAHTIKSAEFEETIAPSSTYSYTYDTAGTYDFTDLDYTHMTGSIVVVESGTVESTPNIYCADKCGTEYDSYTDGEYCFNDDTCEVLCEEPDSCTEISSSNENRFTDIAFFEVSDDKNTTYLAEQCSKADDFDMIIIPVFIYSDTTSADWILDMGTEAKECDDFGGMIFRPWSKVKDNYDDHKPSYHEIFEYVEEEEEEEEESEEEEELDPVGSYEPRHLISGNNPTEGKICVDYLESGVHFAKLGTRQVFIDKSLYLNLQVPADVTCDDGTVDIGYFTGHDSYVMGADEQLQGLNWNMDDPATTEIEADFNVLIESTATKTGCTATFTSTEGDDITSVAFDLEFMADCPE